MTIQDKAVVIWETDKRLQSKDGTTKTESKFKVSVRVKDPSPMTRVVLQLAVETIFCEESLRGETCLESKVIWSVAPKSIIHALLITGVKVFKNLPPWFVAVTNAEAFSATLAFVFISATVAIEVFLESFFR